MTHDELLEVISTGETTRFALADALHAVVELHKPSPWLKMVCAECEIAPDDEHPYSSRVAYPCPTIKAIEKELRG